MFSLLAARDERWDDLLQIRRDVVFEDARDNTEEQETAFPKTRAAELNAIKRNLHHILEVWLEVLLADRLRERADGVHSDSTELLLFTLAAQKEEVLEALHNAREIREELLAGRVGRAADGADDDGLDGDGCGVEQANHLLHDHLEVRADVLVHDLEQRVERGARVALRDGIVHELHDRRHKDRVLRRALFLEPLAEAADRDAARLAHLRV